MNIVVLDGYTLNPGDLTWTDLEALGACQFYDRTPPEKIVERAAEAEIVLTNKTVLSREILEFLPKLKYISVLATGYNVVDVAAARERGILVANVPTYGTVSVAQMVFAHLLNLTQHVADHGRSVTQGDWTRCADFCYWNYPLLELADQTLGIVGLGRIGRMVAEIAKAFGMKVLAYDPCWNATSAEGTDGVAMVGLDALLRCSDVVSLHCPLTPETQHLINAERLACMKPSAFLINTSRGPLVDDQALADALNSDRLAGAGIDVVSEEPPPMNHPLLKAKNCCITPHIAWATLAARKRLMAVTVENLRTFLQGTPQNVVNP